MQKDPAFNELLSCNPGVIWRRLRVEHISFWLICAYLFMEYVRPQTIYPVIDILPWTKLFVVGAFCTSFFDKSNVRNKSSLSGLLILYGVVVLLSSAFAYYPSISFGNLDVYFSWLLVYFAIVRTVRTKERFFIFLLLYMLCNFKMSQHGFVSWARKGFAFDDWGTAGAPGWFQNSGEFGIQLCIFTPIIIAFIFAIRNRLGFIFRCIFYSMPFTAIGSALATSSRGAIFGLGLAGVWSLKTSRYFFRAMMVLLLMGLVAYTFTPPEFKHRFETAGEDRTSRHRLDRWKQGWDTMKQHPLLGVGHQNWPEYFVEHRDTVTEPGTPLVHNLFVECGTELGFLGLFTLGSIFVVMFRLTRGVRLQAKEGDECDRFFYLVAHGMDGATIGLIVSGSFVTVLYYPYVWIHAAFISALYNSMFGAVTASQIRRIRRDSNV